jgi:hypothetical protein
MADQQLTPDSFMASQGRSENPSDLNPDSFMQSKAAPQKPAMMELRGDVSHVLAPGKLSDSLVQPEQANQQTTARARAIVDALTDPAGIRARYLQLADANPTVPGMERLGGVAPGAPAPPAIPDPWETELREGSLFPTHGPGLITGKDQRDIPGTILDTMAQNAGQLASGVERMANPQSLREEAGGLHQAVSGAFGVATPAMLGAGAVAPIRTALTIGAATKTQEGVERGLKALGLPEEYAGVAGDLAGLIAGAATHKFSTAVKEHIATKLQDRWEAQNPAPQPGAAAVNPDTFMAGQTKETTNAVTVEQQHPVEANSEAGQEKQSGPASGAERGQPAASAERSAAVEPERQAGPVTAEEAEAARQRIRQRGNFGRPETGTDSGFVGKIETREANGRPATAEPGATAPAAGVDAGAARPVDAGATGEGPEIHGADAASARRLTGEATDVLVPGEDRSIPARYEVRELADVQASHNGQTFLADEKYPHHNERDYSKPENQQRVINNSSEERFNPRYHITDNPDATNGPSVTDETGNVLGGNSRAMILQRVYQRDGNAAAAYRGLLEKKAPQYGIDPEAVRGMKQPVLLRVVPQKELDALPGGSKFAIRKTNVTGTADLSSSERAAADAGQLSPELVEHIASAIEDAGPDATLNDALTGKPGTAIVNKLISEGFFSEQERPALMDGKTGALTQMAKDRIGKAMVGQYFRDSDQIARTPASIRNKLERIAAPLAKVQGNPEWDLTPAVREAIDLNEYATAHGIKNLGDVTAQQGMFGDEPEQWHSDAVRLAELLRDAKPNDLVAAARRYVNDREPTMFGQATPEEAFAQHFGGEKAAREDTQFAQDLTVPYDASKPRPRDTVFGEARWEVTPARRGRPPILRLNRQALDAVNDAIGKASGGATLKPEGGSVFAERIRGAAESLLSKGAIGMDTARMLYGLAGAFESADPQMGIIYYLSDRSIPLWRRAQILREELTHGRQGETAAEPEKAGAVRAAVMAHPAFGKARAALARHQLYHGASEETVVREITAKIAAGTRGQVGLSYNEAYGLLRAYYSALATHFNVSTADRVLEYADKQGRAAVNDARRRIQTDLQRRRTGEGQTGSGAVEGGVPRLPGKGGRRTESSPPENGGGGEAEFSAAPRELHPDDIKDLSTVGAHLLDQHGPEGWDERMADEFGEGVRPHLEAIRSLAEQRIGARLPDPPHEMARGEASAQLYFGSGLGALEPLFRAAKAEGDALRVQRNEALEAAKKAEATPGEKNAGLAIRHYYTAERDLWAARSNQAIDIVDRKVLPKVQQREAVWIMREFRHKSQELVQMIDGTHPIFSGENSPNPLFDRQKVWDAHKRLLPVMKEALRMMTNPTRDEAAADRVYTNIAEKSLEEGIAGGWMGSRWQSDEYVPHLLHARGKGEVAIAPSMKGKIQGKVGKFFGFGLRRADPYPTTLHAVFNGITPKTLDPSVAFRIHSDNFARARATHLLETQLAQSGLGKWGDGDHVPAGWVQLAEHSREFEQHFVVEDPMTGENRVGRLGLYVPEFIDLALSPITDPDFTSKVIYGFAKLRTAQRGLKEAILGLSGYHLLTENCMAFSDIGPSGMLKAFRATREGTHFLADERDLIASGGTTSIQGSVMDAYRGLRPGTIPTRGEIIRAYLGGKYVLHCADEITRFTFDNIQRRFKVASFALHRNAWLRENPDATAAQIAEAKKGIASYVNGVYGGLHWENMGIPRAMVEVSRALLLAPDWSGSNIALGKYAVKSRVSPGELRLWRDNTRGAVTKESAQARLSRAFWTKQILGGLIATQLLSLALGHRMSRRPYQVYMGEDPSGREVYQNVFFRGSAGDLVSLGTKMEDHGLFVGTGVFIGGKLAPFTKAVMHVITGRDDLGHEIAPKRLSPAANTVRSGGALVSDVSPVPIVARSAYRQMAGDGSDQFLWSERILSLFGQPAQHIAPEGERMTKHGLAPARPSKEAQDMWDEIETGKR